MMDKLKNILRFKKKLIIFLRADCDDIRNNSLLSLGETKIHKVTKEEAECFEDYHDTWNTRKQTIEKIKNGQSLYIAKVNGIDANFQWVNTGEMLDTGIDQKIYIKKGAAYLSGAYTVPKYRGRKLAHKTILKACDEFIKGGGKTIKLVNNVGFKEYLRVQYVKIAFFRFYILKSPGKLCRFLKISKSSDKTFNQKLFVDVM